MPKLQQFSTIHLEELLHSAVGSLRHRQHRNLHFSFDENAQVLFNAITAESYIRPHRHLNSNTDEYLFSLKGCFELILFDEKGLITESVSCGPASNDDVTFGVKIPKEQWHTVVVLESCVLLEVKSGPFKPSIAKEFAPWSPTENTFDALEYLLAIKNYIRDAN